jgi:dihydrodipicolinate synthase/N-acetylneuraminate lyase
MARWAPAPCWVAISPISTIICGAAKLAKALRCGAGDRTLMRDWFTENLVGRFGSVQAILKEALIARGLPGGYPRPPILELDAAGRERVRETLRQLGKI